MKKDTNKWKKYGFSFWVAFSVVAISLGLMGAIFAGFSAYTFVLSNGGIFWVALFVFGLISLACSFFCFRLLPDWADMIRRFRLLDQRFKGAMGATSVSQYLQADEERNRALMASIEAKQNSIGYNLAERIDKLKRENDTNTRTTNANISQMTSTLKAFMEKMDRFTSPLEMQQHRDEVEKITEKIQQYTISNIVNEPKEKFDESTIDWPKPAELVVKQKETEDDDIEVPEPPKDSGGGVMF